MRQEEVMTKEAACSACEGCAQSEGHYLILSSVNAHGIGCDFVFTNCQAAATQSGVFKVLNEENEDGFMVSVFNKNGLGRQYVKTMYETNGAVYVMNVKSLLEKGMKSFTKKVKYEMSKEHSIDIDDIFDFMLVETIMKNRR